MPDRRKSEKSDSRSYTASHPEIRWNTDSGPSITHKSSVNVNHQKQCPERKTTKEGELVKHMSNLPFYLQRPDRGENLQGKALSFGVLDWEQLEKWKCKQKQTPGRSSATPLSHQTKSSSLRSHLTPSAKESCSQAVKPSSSDRPFRKNYSDTDKGKGMDSDPSITSRNGTSSSNSKHKGKMKAEESDCIERIEHSEECKRPVQYLAGRNKSGVLLLPKDSTKKSCLGISQQSEPAINEDGRPGESTRKSFSESFFVNKEVQFADVSSDIPQSCPLPSRVASSKQPILKKYSSVDVHCIQVSSHASASTPFSAEIPSVHSNDKHAKGDYSTIKTTKWTPEPAAAETAKGRYPSLNHLSNVGLGRMGRSCSTREVSAVPQLSSDYVTTKSGPAGLDDLTCLDNSNRDKANANCRARSSPLRRLLDPLLKFKAVNRLYSAEPLQDASAPTHRACEASFGQFDSSTVQPMKRNVSFSSCDPTTNNNGSYQNEKHSTSMVQGILKVTVKDGLPSFTFAVDNNSNILAATVKKLSSSGKYDCSWTYTFYSFCKTKKKSGGWINQGSRCKSQDYNPVVVGEMKVSGSQSPKWTKHKSQDRLMVREFVLFSIEQRQEGSDALEIQPNRELAAIVVMVPKLTTGCVSNDEWQGNGEYKEFSEVGLPGCLPSPFRTTVILPSGAHGLPDSGVPSPLIERWRSGGACDCGGWDVGCNLRVFVNQDKPIEDTKSSEDFGTTDQFDLFIQGDEATQENRLVFSIASFKKGIYSVDFSSTINSLQAFSMCTAILHGRKLAELSEMSSLLQDKTSQEIKSADNSDRKKLQAPMFEEEAPSIYVPFPPISPVWRA